MPIPRLFSMVLVSRDFDLATILKCFADDYSKFIVVDDLDKAIQQLDEKTL